MARERDHAIDIMRGIGIMLVILGHIGLTPAVYKIWLYSFHMPLFFACSGMVFSTKRYNNFSSFLIARLKSLVVPIFGLGFCLAMLVHARDAVLHFQQTGSFSIPWYWGKIAVSLLLGYRLHEYYYSLWFLYVLFAGELVFFFAVRGGKDRPLFYLVLAALGILVQWVVSKYVKGWYWSLDLLPMCVAYLSTGYCLRLMRQKLQRFETIWALLLALAGNILFCVLNYRFYEMPDIFMGVMGNPVYYFAAALLGILFVWIFARREGTLRTTEYFGRNSLVVYAFQNSFAIPVANGVANWLATHARGFENDTVRWGAVFLVTCLISAVLVEVITRFFPFFLGKKWRTKDKGRI